MTEIFAPYMKIEWCRAGLRYDEYVYTFGFQKGILTNQNTAKFVWRIKGNNNFAEQVWLLFSIPYKF